MTIHDAETHFRGLLAETSKKSEIKIYEAFIQILTALKSRNLSEEETQSIETQLDTLFLTSHPVNRQKHYKKRLAQFKAYLKKEFSLITQAYYTNLGVGLGASFGVLFGIIFLSRLERSGGIAIGISIGMLIGLLIGRHLDTQAKAEGRVMAA